MVRLALITFNTETQEFCCDPNAHDKCHTTMGISRRQHGSDCIMPNFIPTLMEHISVDGVKPDLIAFGLQESLENPGHADQLLQALKNDQKDHYELIGKEKNLGTGKAILEGVVRGTRLGIYAKKEIASTVSVDFVSVHLSGFMGGIAKSGIHARVRYGSPQKVISVINTHLPFKGSLRDQGLDKRNFEFKRLLEQFTEKGVLSDDVFFMGDLNYRLTGDTDYTAPFNKDIVDAKDNEIYQKVFSNDEDKYDFLKNYDQLQLSLRNGLQLGTYGFTEGKLKEGVSADKEEFTIDDFEGVRFMPTCKLAKQLENTDNTATNPITSRESLEKNFETGDFEVDDEASTGGAKRNLEEGNNDDRDTKVARMSEADPRDTMYNAGERESITYLEGELIDNSDPTDPETGKGKRLPSNCDRILYKMNGTNIQANCILYDRFDYGNTKVSDHAPVVAVFELINKEAHVGGDIQELYRTYMRVKESYLKLKNTQA